MKFSVKAFVLGVIISAVFVSVKNVYSCDLSAQIDKGIYRAMKKGSIENLYIGSSMFRKGITLYDDPSDSFLIYYNGLDPVAESLILEYMFSNGLKVKNLYVDLFPSTAAKVSWLYDKRMMFDAPLGLKLSVLCQALRNPEAEVIPAVWELLIHSGNDMFILWPLYSRLAGGRYYRGGYSRDTYNRGRTRGELAAMPGQQSESASLNPEQKRAITRIAELCGEYGVNVVFLETPKYSAMFEGGKYREMMGEYLGLLEGSGAEAVVSEAAAGGNVRLGVSVYDFPNDDPALYEDYIHLSTEGSRKFMEVLRGMEGE